MTLSFDPRQFAQLAEDLVAADQSEAKLRTAIGRAYYASFLLARKKTGVLDREQVHRKVINALRSLPGYASAASQLDDLRRLRTDADYDLAIGPDWKHNWAKAKRLANQLLSRL